MSTKAIQEVLTILDTRISEPTKPSASTRPNNRKGSNRKGPKQNFYKEKAEKNHKQKTEKRPENEELKETFSDYVRARKIRGKGRMTQMMNIQISVQEEMIERIKNPTQFKDTRSSDHPGHKDFQTNQPSASTQPNNRKSNNYTENQKEPKQNFDRKGSNNYTENQKGPKQNFDRKGSNNYTENQKGPKQNFDRKGSNNYTENQKGPKQNFDRKVSNNYTENQKEPKQNFYKEKAEKNHNQKTEKRPGDEQLNETFSDYVRARKIRRKGRMTQMMNIQISIQEEMIERIKNPTQFKDTRRQEQPVL